jgi:hypothetical protein
MGRVPLLPRYYETLRLPADLPAALRFLRLAVPSRAPVFVFPAESDADSGAWSIAVWLLPGHVLSRGSRRDSQVPGRPLCIYARVSDPGGIRMPGHGGMPTRPPAYVTVRAIRNDHLFGAQYRASMLAVYASWYGSLHRSTQDSLPAAGLALPGGVGYPPGRSQGFARCFRIPSSFSRLRLAQDIIMSQLTKPANENGGETVPADPL